jgi:hypothetical protein
MEENKSLQIVILIVVTQCILLFVVYDVSEKHTASVLKTETSVTTYKIARPHSPEHHNQNSYSS